MNKYRTELLERFDKKANCKVGKQCGDICIPKQSKCQLNAPDVPKVSPELVKGVASGAGILGMSTASYLAFRAKYRAGFAESAQIAEKMANDVKVEDIPPEQTKITFATGGFYGPMGAEGKKKAEDYFSYKLKTNILDADHHMITHRNDEFNGVENPAMIKVAELAKEGKKPDALLSAQMGVQMFTDHYRQTLETALVKGRNPESVKLAAEVIAYNKKYPDKEIYLTGHSAGGMINHEAAEILDKLKIKVNVVNFGSGYFGLTEKVGNSATIADRGDLYLKTMAGVRDPIYVGEDKVTEEDKHSVRPYMNSPEVVKTAKSLFNQKQNTKKDSADNKGRKCGESHIPKKFKCKKNGKIQEVSDNTKLASVALAGIGLAALPVGAIAAMRSNYIANLPKSAEDVKRQGKAIDPGTLKDFGDKQDILFYQKGFNSHGDSTKLESHLNSLFENSGTVVRNNKDFNFPSIPIDSPDFKGRFIQSAVATTIKPILYDGRNPESVALASEVYAYHLKYPDKPINIIGHSAGGMIVREASDIFNKLEIKHNVAVIASPDFGLFNTKNYIAINSDKDPLSSILPNAKATKVSVEGHSGDDYLSDAKTVDLLKNHFKNNMKTDAYYLARADAMKKAKCKVGKPCGDICIPKKNECTVDEYLKLTKDRKEARIKAGKTARNNYALLAVGFALAGTASLYAAAIMKGTGVVKELVKKENESLAAEEKAMNDRIDKQVDEATKKVREEQKKLVAMQATVIASGSSNATPESGGVWTPESYLKTLKKEVLTEKNFPLSDEDKSGLSMAMQQINDLQADESTPDGKQVNKNYSHHLTVDYYYSIAKENSQDKELSSLIEEKRKMKAEAVLTEKLKLYVSSSTDKSALGMSGEDQRKLYEDIVILGKYYKDSKLVKFNKDLDDTVDIVKSRYKEFIFSRELSKQKGKLENAWDLKNDTYLSSRARNDSVLSTQDRIQLQCKILLSRASKEPIAKISKVKATSNGSLSGLFSIKNKTFKFDINDKNITYSAVTARIDSFQRFMRFDAKKKKCKIGIACGETCIGSRKKCELSTSAIAKPSEMRQLKMTASKLFVEQNPINAAKPEKPVNDYEINPDTKQPYTIRDLKKIAGSRGIFGYGSMTMKELKESLALNDKDPDSGRRIAESITKRRTTSSRLIDAAGLKGKNKGAEGNTKKTISELLDNWKRIEALSKFAGNNTLQWSAAAVGAFLIGTTVRTYEKAKEDYRDGFDESAKIAQERAAKINLQHPEESNGKPVIRNGKQVMTSKIKQDNITFAVGSGKGHGAEEIKSLLLDGEKGDKSDEWLKKSHYVIPFNLQETGSPKLSATGNPAVDAANDVVNGFGDSMRNWKQKRNQDSVDLAAQIYAHAIAVDQTDGKTLVNANKKINLLAHGYGGQVTKEALEILARMEIKGSPPGKEVLKQVNAVYLGTPHFGFAENVSRRQRTIVSQQDPVAMLPTFGDGARQQWISSVSGHAPSDYLKDPRVRESVKEAFGYYQGSPEEIRRTQRKQRARLSFKPKSSKPTKPPENKQNNSDSYNIQYQSTIQEIVKL